MTEKAKAAHPGTQCKRVKRRLCFEEALKQEGEKNTKCKINMNKRNSKWGGTKSQSHIIDIKRIRVDRVNKYKKAGL